MQIGMNNFKIILEFYIEDIVEKVLKYRIIIVFFKRFSIVIFLRIVTVFKKDGY